MKLIKVINEEQLRILSNLSNIIWHEFFPSILSNDQIEYMVDKFQSYKAMKKQIEDGYEYYLFYYDNNYISYTCIKRKDNRLFISKIYLLKEYRGKGLIKKAFSFYDEVVKSFKLDSMYLTVNKYNNNAIKIYQKFGFKIIDDVVTDIGSGYVMDDYVMEKEGE